MEMKKRYEKTACGIRLFCDVIKMGRDYTICLWNETGGHVGSVCLSVARPSLTGSGTSATTSVLNCAGHKDELIAREIAEAAAVKGHCTAVCSCGVHLDGITPKQISEISEACRELKKELLKDID
ncbi:MAG: hypothetical protein LUD81_05245 [Clostridiales bacterium]|nr:hypothetical protein [Clostridiales bacterium]